MTETPSRVAVVWLSSILLSVLFVAFQIQSSLHSGALSLPSTYDDLNYFNDAMPRLEMLYRDGGRAFALGLLTSPPHAPLQTFLALAGFGLFGPNPWAAYAMNVLPLTLLLRLLLAYTARVLPLASGLAVAIALLGFPLVGLMVLDFRPDMLCALLTATGALVVVADPSWRAGERRSFLLACALFVGALLAKPTLAPVTVVVFGVAAAAVACLQARSRGDAWRLLWLGARCGTLGAALALPYYIAALPHLIEYIHVNVFGTQANIWKHQYSLRDNALYYLTGPGGNVAVGRAWLALTGTLLILALPKIIRQWRTSVCVLLVALAGYSSVTLPAMKSPYLGLVVPALIFGVVAILVIELLSALPPRTRLPLALILIAFSAVAWRPVAIRLWNEPAPTSRIENYGRILSQTVDAIAAVPDLGRRRLYFPLIAQYLNQDNVAFELRRRGLAVPATPELYFNSNLPDHKAAIATADLVVLFSDDCTLPIPWPASVTIRKEIGAAVADSGAFEPIARVDGGPYGGSIIILQRKSS